jgi:hypothetical protein
MLLANLVVNGTLLGIIAGDALLPDQSQRAEMAAPVARRDTALVQDHDRPIRIHDAFAGGTPMPLLAECPTRKSHPPSLTEATGHAESRLDRRFFLAQTTRVLHQKQESRLMGNDHATPASDRHAAMVQAAGQALARDPDPRGGISVSVCHRRRLIGVAIT